MAAALRAMRAKNPKKLIGAVAVASTHAAGRAARVRAMVCLNVPADFSAVGEFFDDFDQVSDQDVIEALRESDAKISAVG